MTSLTVVDCSHVVDCVGTSVWPGGQLIARCPFHTVAADGFANEAWVYGCDAGTHTDAPVHFFKGGRTITDLTPAELVAPAVVVDVAAKCAADADYALSVEDLAAWEAAHGRIPDGSLVCMRTGWAAKFGDPAAYCNADAAKTLHFPGFGEAAAKFLLSERSVAGIGIDTLSLDCGNSTSFPVHVAVLGASKYQVENMVLDAVPPAGAVFVTLPFKVKGVQEASARVFCLDMARAAESELSETSPS